MTPTIHYEGETAVCSCGARASKGERKRFLKRHPALCSVRKEFTKQVAQGTRCVDAEARDEAIGRRWDRLEAILEDMDR